MHKASSQSTIHEQIVNFAPTTVNQHIHFNDFVGDIVKIELLDAWFSGIQATDVGLPWTLRIPIFTVEDFVGYKLPQFVVDASSAIVDEARTTKGKDIGLVFTGSPTTIINPESPYILLEGKRLQSRNIISCMPSIVSTLDGVTVPFFDTGSLRLRFYCAMDSMSMKITDPKYVPLISEKLRY